MLYVSQISVVYNLNSAVCQLYLNKTGKNTNGFCLVIFICNFQVPQSLILNVYNKYLMNGWMNIITIFKEYMKYFIIINSNSFETDLLISTKEFSDILGISFFQSLFFISVLSITFFLPLMV